VEGGEGRGRIISLTSHYNLERTLVFHSPPPSPISHPKPLVLSSLSSQLSSCFSLCSTRDPRLSSPSSPPSFQLARTALPLSCPLQPCVQPAHRPRENPKSNRREHTQSTPVTMSEGAVAPSAPVVAEAHEVDTYRESPGTANCAPSLSLSVLSCSPGDHGLTL
jgi:hypothetical protein